MNNNQEKSSYKETGNKVTSTLGAIGAGLESTAKEVSKNLDISNLGKTIIKWSPKPISSTLNVHSIATAQGEKEVFTEVYEMGVSSVGAGMLGVAGATVFGPLGAGGGAGVGNWLGNEIAEATADFAYPLYQATKDYFQDFLSTSYLSLTITPNNSNNSPKDSNDSSSTTSPIAFKITKAHIKESLEELFVIECEGYIESMQEQLISFSQNTLNLHPKSLIDTLATFTITNPYNNNTLNFMDSADKSYKGILSAVNYLGLNQESSKQLLESFYIHSFLQKAS